MCSQGFPSVAHRPEEISLPMLKEEEPKDQADKLKLGLFLGIKK